MIESSGREEHQFFLDRCERAAVTGDTMNYVSFSIATANPITSANTGEGMVSSSVLGLSTQWTDGVLVPGGHARRRRRLGGNCVSEELGLDVSHAPAPGLWLRTRWALL